MRWLAFLILLLVPFGLVISWRWTGFYCYILTLLIYAIYLLSKEQRWFRYQLVFSVITICFVISPIDISMKNYPGGPRFVPYSKGLPRPMLKGMQERGEVYIGSDLVSRFQPKWVLVW